MRDTFGNIGISIATNVALFTSLDLGQWIADTLSLWTLPANLLAAVIATALGLSLTAATRVFGVNRTGLVRAVVVSGAVPGPARHVTTSS
jgi:hypothetical protein